MFFPVSDAASVAGQWLAAGVLTMADVFGIPWQLLAVSVIYTVIYTTANVGHGVLWLCVRLRAAAAGCEWSASSGSAFCRRGVGGGGRHWHRTGATSRGKCASSAIERMRSRRSLASTPRAVHKVRSDGVWRVQYTRNASRVGHVHGIPCPMTHVACG